MHGYFTYTGFMGWLPSINDYRLFATEQDYYEYYREIEA